jgi:predicted MPP superfamily phosphohydrolase
MFSFGRINVEKIRLNGGRIGDVASRQKLLHLSDLHISRFGAREKNLVDLVNREKPDIIVITGDLVVNYRNNFSACLRTLRKLKARLGIYAVLGNAEHTFDWVQDFQDFKKALKECDVILLNNRHAELKLNGKSLYLVGVDDPFFLFDNFDKAIKDVPVGEPTILMAHTPDILLPRADALVMNLLDSGHKKDHFKTWGWKDSTRFSPETGDVYFEKEGTHTLRVQSRQSGVFLDTVLLNPYGAIDEAMKAGEYERIERLLKRGALKQRYPDLAIISGCDIDPKRVHGKWRKAPDVSALSGFHLDDLPAKKMWQFQPLIHPENYFEADFHAKKATRYRVWMRMKAYRGNPKNDSVYLQFSGSVDHLGAAKYRISEPAHSKSRMGDVDLILTGHTHGGQIRLPFYGPIETMTSMGKEYAAGLHQFGKSMLYVSRGVGTSLLPIRFLCPAEITVFDFHV